MKRQHLMPFGPRRQADGTVCFRLWAPGAQRVDLVVGVGDSQRRAGGGQHRVRVIARLVGGAFHQCQAGLRAPAAQDLNHRAAQPSP